MIFIGLILWAIVIIYISCSTTPGFGWFLLECMGVCGAIFLLTRFLINLYQFS